MHSVHLLTPTRKNIEGIILDSVSAVVLYYTHIKKFSEEKKAYYLPDCFILKFKLIDRILTEWLWVDDNNVLKTEMVFLCVF